LSSPSDDDVYTGRNEHHQKAIVSKWLEKKRSTSGLFADPGDEAILKKKQQQPE